MIGKERNGGKETGGFFRSEEDLAEEEQKGAIKNTVMKRLEELGVFDEDENQEKIEKERM